MIQSLYNNGIVLVFLPEIAANLWFTPIALICFDVIRLHDESY